VRGKDPGGSKELVEEIIRIEEVKMLSAIADPKTKIDVVLRKMQELRKRIIKAQQQAAACSR
jgi:ribosomal protein S30